MKTINYDRRALVTSMIASGLDDVNVMFLAFSLSSIIADLNISSTQAGWIGTITNFGMLFGGLVFGVLADRYNKYKVLKWTVAIFSVATALIFFSQSINTLLALRFLAGIGVGGEYGVALAIMAGIVPSNKMGRISSLNGVMGQIGSITSAVLASLIAPIFGWRGLFALGILPLILVTYMHFMIKEDQITDRGSQKVDRQQAGKISDLFKTPALAHQTIALMVMTSVQIAGYFGMMNWLPTMMQGKLGISLGNSNLWMITTIVGMSIGMLVFGYFLDMFGPRLVYGVFLIMSAISVFAFTYVNSALSLLFGGALMGFFVNGMFAGYGAMVTRLYPHQVRAVANNTILNVGRAIGGFSSLIIGMILENYDMSAVMIFLTSLYIVSFCFMISIKNLKQERYQTIHTTSPALEPAKA
ncbi:MFS transporter [Facklamia sp. 7083-14-GEN3]|uniref:MFS transporter n=1 Tax=Facklamia sp. 7083-14-GEN3 TaxID=2973478 RepID=UPI00215D4D58|nr:MFS transporter [Facklamia sp. 7083-14-GEN3]MCR8969769.1 MFS transporter [Facklamia sp. 7083-14-GEN3]